MDFFGTKERPLANAAATKNAKRTKNFASFWRSVKHYVKNGMKGCSNEECSNERTD